jgi:hypothetical protein
MPPTTRNPRNRLKGRNLSEPNSRMMHDTGRSFAEPKPDTPADRPVRREFEDIPDWVHDGG